MLNERMKNLGEERSVIREIFEYANKRAEEIGRENVFDFSIGNPSAPTPATLNDELLRLLKETPSQVLHGYTSASGLRETRRAIANWLQTEYGVPMSEELVYMTCGAAASLSATLSALTEERNEFIVIAPYFPEYRVFIEQVGGKVVSVRADARFHLDIEGIERAITARTKAILINSPNNPTGAVYGEEELTALAAVLEEKSKEFGKPIFLISDEPYRALSYGKKMPCPARYYPNTVVCDSFSKALTLAGERIGYVAVGPACTGAEELFLAVCGAGRSLGYVCAPALFQRAIVPCLGQTADLSDYIFNRDTLYRKLTELGFECVEPEGAFYLFMRSPEEDAKKFCERAKKYELLFVPSDGFGIEGYVRISYCVSRDTVLRSLPAFEKLAREYAEK